MDDHEKKIIKVLSAAVSGMPDTKKEYLLGYAEAIADMKSKAAEA